MDFDYRKAGFKLNPDKELVKLIRKGIKQKKGHCPCEIKISPENLCPCKKFRETGECKCQLFVINMQ
ncbi:MAG: ferredoxin-thioredoxin reductase catalytic domain-containing protein [bacterium]